MLQQTLPPLKCTVPENIHTHSKEGHWKFWQGGHLKSQNLKGKYEANLHTIGGGGSPIKILSKGEVWILYLEPHNIYSNWKL